MASAKEKGADEEKTAKEKITVNACANVTGSIRLPLLFIGKAKHPRCFRGINKDETRRMPGSNREIFLEWFQDYFVP